MVYVAVAAVHNAEAEMNVVGQAGQVAEGGRRKSDQGMVAYVTDLSIN